MLRTICCQLGQDTAQQGLQIQQSFPTALTLYGDPLLIEKAITNLVENAMEAMPGGGTIHVSATSDAAAMDIRIQDGGRGIESHDVEHISTPFSRPSPDPWAWAWQLSARSRKPTGALSGSPG